MPNYARRLSQLQRACYRIISLTITQHLTRLSLISEWASWSDLPLPYVLRQQSGKLTPVRGRWKTAHPACARCRSAGIEICISESYRLLHSSVTPRRLHCVHQFRCAGHGVAFSVCFTMANSVLPVPRLLMAIVPKQSAKRSIQGLNSTA